MAELLEAADGGETGGGDVKAIRRQQLFQVQIPSDLLHDRFHLRREGRGRSAGINSRHTSVHCNSKISPKMYPEFNTFHDAEATFS